MFSNEFTQKLYGIFKTANENKLYNKLVKSIGINTSHNNIRDFASGLRPDFPITTLEKILSMFGYELRFYIVKTSDEEKDKIQMETSKEFFNIIDNTLKDLLSEVEKKEELKKQREQNKKKSKEKKEIDTSSYLNSLSTDYGITDEMLSESLDNDLSLSNTFKRPSEKI